MRSLPLGLLAVALLGLFLMGCTNSKPKELVVIYPTWAGYGPMYIAQEKGFFEKRGLNVKILTIEGLSERRAIFSSGQADIQMHTIDMGIVDAGAGINEVFVYMVDESKGADGVISRQSINSLKDLEGKKVACQIGVPAYFFLRELMKKESVDKNKVQFLDIPQDEAGAAFLKGEADAACTWEPWLSKAKAASGGKILVSSADVPGKIVDIIAVSPQSLKNRRTEIKAFVEAWIEAEKYVKAHPDESYPIMAKAFSMDTNEFANLSLGFRWNSSSEAKSFFSGPVYGLASEIRGVAVEDGITQKPIDVNSMIDPSIASEAG